MGNKIDQHGIHPIGPTLDAITRTSVPSNVTELQSFIGMVNHYGQTTVYKTKTSTQFIMCSGMGRNRRLLHFQKFGIFCPLLLLSTHSHDPCQCGRESDLPTCGPPFSFSAHLAGSAVTLAGLSTNPGVTIILI